MKNFNHNLVSLPKLERIDGEIRRYKTPTGNLYPSVTTVLSALDDKSSIEKWKNRIGIEEANKITARSAKRGTQVHKLCEDLVLNRSLDLKSEMPFNKHLFSQIRSVLELYVDNIRGSELLLYSDKLKIAGTCDLIAEYNNKLSIIDFKTSIKNKKKEWIENYFLQTALYSYMFYEMTGILHSQLVIIIAVEEETQAQVFVEPIKSYIPKAVDMCKTYHKQMGLQIS